jgi:uncharacterized membrane protein
MWLSSEAYVGMCGHHHPLHGALISARGIQTSRSADSATARSCVSRTTIYSVPTVLLSAMVAFPLTRFVPGDVQAHVNRFTAMLGTLRLRDGNRVYYDRAVRYSSANDRPVLRLMLASMI